MPEKNCYICKTKKDYSYFYGVKLKSYSYEKTVFTDFVAHFGGVQQPA